MANDLLQTYIALLPEIILVLGAIALLLIGVFNEDKAANALHWMTLIIIIAAGVAVTQIPGEEIRLFNGGYILDGFARFMKVLTLIGAAVVLYMSSDFLRANRLLNSELQVLILFATAGMMLMISAGDLITLYLGLEMQSLSLYVIAAYRRDSVRSSEAGLKYFVLGALSSGMLLYGSSLIYGFTGTIVLKEIAAVVQQSGPTLGIIFGLVFILAALAFKISAVPFHMWTPDVYEGAPTPVTAFFASAPKVAAMALLIRVVLEAFPSLTGEWRQIIVFVSIASMLLGAFAAIGQRNIKRLMAYSSIGHMGFALVGLAAGSVTGVTGVIVYITIYLAMTLGAFACILSMRLGDQMVEDINDLAGLARNNLYMAFVLGVLFFSLAGIPPLAGFFAKFFVFSAAIKAGLYPLAIIGVLASVVAAFYYLRIVKIMFFDEPADRFEPVSRPLQLVLTLSLIFVLFFFVYPSPLIAAADVAAKTLF